MARPSGGVEFLLMVNKMGQTRLASWFTHYPADERRRVEAELVRQCLARSEKQSSFFSHRGHTIVFRRYASLFFIAGVQSMENEMAVLEFIHCCVEALDKYFGSVCELDIMFHIDRVHFVVEEMAMGGHLVEGNKSNALAPVHLLDHAVHTRS